MRTPADVTSGGHAVIEGAPPATDPRRLDRSFLGSLAWSGAGRWLTQLISWPATILIARMLSPADYGLVVLVRVYTDFIGMLTEAGLGSAVTIAPEMDDVRAGQLHTLSMMMGATAVVVACAVAAPLRAVYERPGLEWLVMALSAIFVIEALGVVPNGLLRREFRYKAIAVADWARSLTDLVVELTLAFMGFGYWTLVAGYLAGAVAWQAVVLYNRPLRYRAVRFADVGATLRTMRHMVAQSVTAFTVNNSDVMVAGRIASTGAVGAYSFALQLASVPAQKVIGFVANVTPSLFRQVAHDPPLFRRYVLLITEGLCALVLPAFIGIALVAPDFTAAVLGDKWSGIVVPLRLLALHAAVASLFTVLPQVLWATNRGHLVTRYGLLNLFILPPLFIILGTRYGVNGIALAWLVGGPAVATLRARAALGVLALPAREYARSLWPALSSTAVMTVVVLAAQVLLAHAELPAVARLAVTVGAGAAGYAGAVLLFHKSRVYTAVAAVRAMRR